MARTMQTISAGAAATLRLSLNTIDTIAAAALPVHQAGQRCGRRFRPIIAAAWRQIDWQEVLTIVITGLAIVAIASWRCARWSHRTLINGSAALGQRYAAWLAPAPVAPVPMAPVPAAVDRQPVICDPQPAAAVMDHEPAIREPQPALPNADAPQRAARTKVSKLPKPAPKPSRQSRAKGSSRTTAPALA